MYTYLLHIIRSLLSLLSTPWFIVNNEVLSTPQTIKQIKVVKEVVPSLKYLKIYN